MRFVSVLGAIGVGLGVGSAAVLAPLTISSAGSSIINSAPLQWASEWGHQALGVVETFTTRVKTKTVAQSEAAVLPTGTPVPDQETKTIDYLAQHPAGEAPKVADARIVQTPWSTQVTVAPEVAAPRKLTSSKPANEEQRTKLVRDLQGELKRVGCFEGEVDGHWGPSSRRAIAAFNERVNASLPFDQPDLILLTLVQGHKGRACGTDCPAGQGQAENGRCVPKSVLAQAERAKQGEAAKPDRLAANTNDESKPKSSPPVVMAVPGIAAGWSAKVAPSPAETSAIVAAVPAPAPVPPAPVRVIRPPVVAAAPPVAKPVELAKPVEKAPRQAIASVDESSTSSAVRNERVLPGRMTMGAPLPLPDAARPTAANPNAAASTPKRDTKMAAVDTTLAENPAAAVTQAEPAADPAPKAHKPRPAHSNAGAVQSAPRPRRAPEPVVVHRPPPPPAKVYFAPPVAKSDSGSKSRRLVYEMFQRPDRN